MANPSASTPNPDLSPQNPAPNFEQTLARLEEVVRLLEDGKVGLDDALGGYEEGVGLLRQAYDMLQRAERRITLLTGLDTDGNPILRPIEDAASFSASADAGDTAIGKKPTSRRPRRALEPE